MSHYTYLEGKGYLVKDNRGFTLIELLTALGLVGLVLSIILSPIIFSYNSFHNQNQKASSISNAGRAMDYITREIRKASEIEVLSDSALKLGSFIYEVDDGVLYKKDQDKGGKKAIVKGINELTVVKNGKRIDIEIAVISSKEEVYRLSSTIYER